MSTEQVLESLKKQFPDRELSVDSGKAGDSWIVVQPADIKEIMAFLCNEQGLNYLACLSGVDYEDALAVVYQIRSLESLTEVMVKVMLPRESPKVSSLWELYGAADWFEREAFDLLGIEFEGHPDLRRIMMPEDWIGYPLRKDYVFPEEYHGMPCSRPDPHELMKSRG